MDFSGIDRFLGRAVDHFAGKGKELMEECGEIIASGIDEAFETSIAPDKTPWKQSERAKREAGKTLVDDKTLRGSIGYEAAPDAVAVGTNVEYAVYHQQPERPGEVMPKREFIGISEDTGEELQDALDDFMGKGLGE